MVLVSGMKKVNSMPAKLTTARAVSVTRVPAPSWSWPNPNAPTTAPAFPKAADTPCRVDRKRVWKTSEGTINVVALGPKLAKKKVTEYRTRKTQGDAARVDPAGGTRTG